MDPTVQFLVSLAITVAIGLVGIYYQRRQLQFMSAQAEGRVVSAKDWRSWRYWPILLMGVFAALAWIPQIIHHDPAPVRLTAIGYGKLVTLPSGDKVLPVFGDLSELAKTYGENNRVLAAALKYQGTTDIADVDIWKSQVHDFHIGTDRLNIEVDDKFMDLVNKGVAPTYYFIIVVPKTLSSSQFKTLREAEALHCVVIQIGAGPPP